MERLNAEMLKQAMTSRLPAIIQRPPSRASGSVLPPHFRQAEFVVGTAGTKADKVHGFRRRPHRRLEQLPVASGSRNQKSPVNSMFTGLFLLGNGRSKRPESYRNQVKRSGSVETAFSQRCDRSARLRSRSASVHGFHGDQHVLGAMAAALTAPMFDCRC